jgi:hypothetical protein
MGLTDEQYNAVLQSLINGDDFVTGSGNGSGSGWALRVSLLDETERELWKKPRMRGFRKGVGLSFGMIHPRIVPFFFLFLGHARS